MAAEKQPSSSVIFWVAGGVTIAWPIIALALGWTAHPGDAGATYGSLKANEWGDFLAGVFAPVAFFWLFAAVWLQSKELKAQREELELTREEMQEQRRVMTAQAEYIGTQTEILRAEEADRKTARLDAFFDEHFDTIAALLRQSQATFAFQVKGKDDFTFYWGAPVSRSQLEGFGAGLLRFKDKFFEAQEIDDADVFRTLEPDALIDTRQAFIWAKEAATGISSMAQLRYIRYGIDDALDAIGTLAEKADLAA